MWMSGGVSKIWERWNLAIRVADPPNNSPLPYTRITMPNLVAIGEIAWAHLGSSIIYKHCVTALFPSLLFKS